ncbi:WD40 repeat-like protein [Eremomyces bilateralis CBS 781.70]|uniref:Ribosome biogenesis protein YTM1 n=1 Tax=Eremomyces bilateralis CBS 781.70 TaxID=1392243 RepID=A0A6G1GCQ8_9PEZI|nr:WD40 repeat-like protein [Eremomyces bilateralis CBS 781.70]KAF1815696.1 WD40 repeat-like protein [Eremomyces bilateralis CBS 781.70]
MPTDDQLADAILQSVEASQYPDSEAVVSAELPPSTFPTLLDGIEQSRAKLKAEIRHISRTSTTDIDAWIAQARHLQQDIDDIREETRQIDHATNEVQGLKGRANDAGAKVGFLKTELAFNDALVDTLGCIQRVSGDLDGCWEAVRGDDVGGALGGMGRAVKGMGDLEAFEGAHFVGLLRDRAKRVRDDMVETVTGYWWDIVHVNQEKRALVVKKSITRKSEILAEDTVRFAEQLDIYDDLVSKLQHGLERSIIAARFGPENADDSAVLSVDDNTLSVSTDGGAGGALAAIEDIKKLTRFLSSELPTQLSLSLSQKLVASLTSHLVSTWLQEAIPISLDEMNEFQQLLDQVLSLAEHLEGLGWSGNEELINWVETAPRSWLSKRKEAMLAAVRTSCYRGVRTRKTVERVETQLISHEDLMGPPPDQSNDWDAEWDNDGADADQQPASEPTVEEEDMDASAWGLEEEGQDQVEQKPDEDEKTENDDEGGDEADAWGWGEDDAEDATTVKESAPAKPAASKPPAGHVHGKEAVHENKAEEITLRETYTVTAIPDEILQLIQEVVSDAETLSQERYADSPIAGAAMGLYSIPTLALAMYRATAITYYSKDNAGNILVYNDCTRLADQLHNYLSSLAQRDETSPLPPKSRPSQRLRLTPDLQSLSSFGKRAYGREMDSQRTILSDLLAGAQGFAHCTEPPFAAECDSAVRFTVDRIREVHAEWRPILSHSALLQSVGSLAATVIGKMILDIEDMADISEEESKTLSALCGVVTGVGELFVQRDDAGEERDMTGVYTPNWFKFRYLMEILESSLADIKFAWTEAGLREEFEAEEVADLIQALFAESADLKRYALSTLVNSLLESEKPVPFEFLINGQFLRTTLDEFLTANGISAETTLSVEYVRALLPPTQTATFPHDDWVSSVDVLSATSPAARWTRDAHIDGSRQRILSGSYDGLVRVWNTSSELVATSPSLGNGGHTGGVKSVKFLSPTKLVSASLDRTIRIWSYKESTTSPATATIDPAFELYGHQSSVDSIAVHGPSGRILSASSDHTVGVWTAHKSSAPEAPTDLLPSSLPSSKRRKLSRAGPTVPQRGPLALLAGHAAPVTGVAFSPTAPNVAYSVSQDHTLRTWDLLAVPDAPNTAEVSSRMVAHPLLSVCVMPGLSLVAAGTSARSVVLIDPREGAARVVAKTLKGHANSVVALAQSPVSEYGLASASHDGEVRVWDVRGGSIAVQGGDSQGDEGKGLVVESVFTLPRESMKGKPRKVAGEGVKVLGMAWDRDIGIVSGGEDKMIQINREAE